jgi:hypothetical protein
VGDALERRGGQRIGVVMLRDLRRIHTRPEVRIANRKNTGKPNLKDESRSPPWLCQVFGVER